MKIIGLGNKKQVGKDTAAGFIKEYYNDQGLSVEVTSFATPLYFICEYLYGWAGFKTKAYYDKNPRDKEKPLVIGKSPRQILIDLSTAGVRTAVYNDTWIDYMFKRPHEADVLIITDVRFPNEAQAIHEHGGFIFKVSRPIDDTPDVADMALDSDKGWWDFTLVNDGTLEKFREHIFTIFAGANL